MVGIVRRRLRYSAPINKRSRMLSPKDYHKISEELSDCQKVVLWPRMLLRSLQLQFKQRI
jgi:hypothetical protein